jgi:zinc protease
VSLNLVGNPSAPRVAWSAEVATPRTAEALTAIDRSMRAMKTADVAQAELDDARRPLLGEQTSWVTSLTGETDVMNGLVVQQVPPSDLPKRAARLRSVTVDDVRRVAASYLDPDRMKVVVVGDWSKLREQLVALGWGPIEVRDSSGVVDPARSVR